MKKTAMILMMLCFASGALGETTLRQGDYWKIFFINGEYYHFAQSETYSIEENVHRLMNERKLPQSTWHDIIEHGHFDLASALLSTLCSRLSKEELWPYIETALRREANFPEYSLAMAAYKILATEQKTENIRAVNVHPEYRRNMWPNVLWMDLFSGPVDDRLNTARAAEQLALLAKNNRIGQYPLAQFNSLDENTQTPEQQLQARQYSEMVQLMSRIARSEDTQYLAMLAEDAPFMVALPAWFALSRLAPKRYAETILRRSAEMHRPLSFVNIYCPEDVNFGFCQLYPAEAAHVLFAEVVSADTLREILLSDSLLMSLTASEKQNSAQYRQELYKSMKANHHWLRVVKTLPEWPVLFSELQEKLNTIKQCELDLQDGQRVDAMCVYFLTNRIIPQKTQDGLLEAALNQRIDDIGMLNSVTFMLDRNRGLKILQAVLHGNHFSAQVTDDLLYRWQLKIIHGTWPKIWDEYLPQVIEKIRSRADINISPLLSPEFTNH